MSASLVGSEMCIRDRSSPGSCGCSVVAEPPARTTPSAISQLARRRSEASSTCRCWRSHSPGSPQGCRLERRGG
eukprot:2472537-Alexandrium_andersonii.AAC.1